MENKLNSNSINTDIATMKASDLYENSYTNDSFTCSLCEWSTTNIDNYVFHMTNHSECYLVIEKSSHLDDLMLPRFRKKPGIDPNENGKVSIKDRGHLDQVSPIVTLIKTDEGERWKCSSCRLTFSRQAAVLNHLKLQHPQKIEKVGAKTMSVEATSSNTNLIDKKSSNDLEKIDSKENIRLVSNDRNLKSDSSNTACHLCGQICKTALILTRHLTIAHSQNRPFLCSIDSCTMSFKTKGSLVRHQRRHTDARPYSCSKCSRSFRESGTLLRHQMASISCSVKSSKMSFSRYGSTMPFKQCKIEEKGEWQISLKTEDAASCAPNVNRESEEHTPEESKATVWQQIMAAKSVEAAKSSAKVASSLVDKKPAINLSGMKKESINATDDHAESEMESQNSDLTLPDDITKILQKLEEPERVDTKPPAELRDESLKVIQTSHYCPVCSKSYNSENFLIRHLKGHKNELGPSLECPTCRKCFTSLSLLCRHLISHSNLRQFACSLCGKSFKLKAHAFIHLKAHSEEKNFSCPDCGRKFKTASARNFHHRTHSGLVTFECEVCFRNFSTKSSFQRHTRVHSGVRPFHCPYCKMAFKEHGTLNRHLNNKAPCSQKHRGEIEDSKIDIEKSIERLKEESAEKEEDASNSDLMSEPDSELDSYLSEFDLSSIYSDHSQMSFDPDECFLPLLETTAHVDK